MSEHAVRRRNRNIINSEPLQYRLYIGSKSYSSWSMRPWLLMMSACIPFEEILVPFEVQPGLERKPTDRHAKQLDKISPNAKVPALEIDGKIIWESTAICMFLDENFPDLEIIPRSKIERAECISTSIEAATGFLNFRLERLLNLRVTGHIKTPLSKEATKDLHRLQKIAENRKSTGRNLVKNYSIVDAMLTPYAFRIINNHQQISSDAFDYFSELVDYPAARIWSSEAKAEPEKIEALDLIYKTGLGGASNVIR